MSAQARPRRARVTIERVPYDAAAWEAVISSRADAEVYHSPAWLEFLAESQGAEPVVAVVAADGRPVGHFVGGVVRRFGLRILGSPAPGWTTQTMGFLLEPGADRRAAADALPSFAFRQLGCVHVELADRHLPAACMEGSAFEHELGGTFLIDLARDEEAIFAGLPAKTRQHVRRAMRSGLRAEVGGDVGFADEYMRLLTEVFARQGLAPTYGIDRVRTLIRTVQSSGQLQLLSILTPDGETVAAGLSIGRNTLAVAWGMAWSRSHSALHPIDLLWWERIRYWHGRGATTFDMGGRGDYKAKYGGVATEVVHYHRSRYAMLRVGRSGVRRLVRARQLLTGRGRGTPAASTSAGQTEP